jgi:hypothetical protein
MQANLLAAFRTIASITPSNEREDTRNPWHRGMDKRFGSM